MLDLATEKGVAAEETDESQESTTLGEIACEFVAEPRGGFSDVEPEGDAEGSGDEGEEEGEEGE